ncbi:hypothetical protein [Colwellia sp. MB02u-14]|uniref:hypothetical protein n=1 Tax=Colwellia sp. MB02u-14 TaxID=2759815 RepID=UPI0015F541E8|nr:hypothetical protein [Colwellia sp. MB02u-14]MBA6304204.1 hypothetical protein [Colwellia sp. MB02u-14]
MNNTADKSNNLPATLKRWLDISEVHFPGIIDRASHSLATLLQKNLSKNAHQDAWKFSSLAGGFPVEFTFKTNQRGIQYTVDVAAAEVVPQQVLPYALELLSQLQPDTLTEQDLDFFSTMQQCGKLSYGCWVGGQHCSDADEYKLYIEVPEGGDSMAVEWLNRQLPFDIDLYRKPIAQHNKIKLEIIGYSLKSKDIECYFSIVDMAPWEIDEILKPVGMEQQRDSLVEQLQGAYQSAIYRKLPSREMGFSYAFSPATKHKAFSLYTFASSMFGSDRHAREAILSLCDKMNCNMDYYDQFTAQGGLNKSETSNHGLFGIALDSNANTTIYTGLRPHKIAPKPQQASNQ